MTVAVEVQREARWQRLVDGLATRLAAGPPGPFDTVTVIVSSRGAGRLLSQALATRLPDGICAGVSFPTLAEWVRARAAEHGLLEDLEAWRSVRATVVAAGALDALGAGHPILAAHLNAEGSPARRQQLAHRSVQLFRRYVEHAPDMVGAWLEESDVDALGEPLAAHLTWQPALLRLVAERLEVDPVETWQSLAGAVASQPSELGAHVLAVSEVSVTQRLVLEAAAAAGPLTVWQVSGSPFEDWTRPDGSAQVAVPPTPAIELHGSHGPARQAEVLRDELCRRFEADPTLEARDVVIICPDPAGWWPQLRSVFAPVEDDPAAHPGRRLRLQSAAGVEANHVLRIISECLRLTESRATATELTELLLLSPIAHRWRLGHRREELMSLVEESGIRWGLDPQHRALLGVPGITQNTWVRGIDRLLTGLAVAPGTDAGLAVTGVAGVSTSSLDLVGALAELVSRLRRFNAEAATPVTADVWVGRVRSLLADIVGCSFDDEWMALEASAALTGLTEQLAAQPTPLNRNEFTRLFEFVTRDFPPRPSVGNGALHVIAPGDLVHVDFRLVCFLGMGDGYGGSSVDSVALGPDVLEPRRLRLARLLAHARAADEVLVVHQTRDPLTDQEMARPTTLSWFLRELDAEDATVVQHPLLAHSEGNFIGERPSHDRHGLAAALALREAAGRPTDPRVRRRRDALALPVEPLDRTVSLKEITSFLADPARDFLRAAAEVRIWDGPQLTDEMPFVPDGLESWQTRDRFLEAFRQGLDPHQAMAREFERELVPPGRVGSALLEQPGQDVAALWRAAHGDWNAPVADHRVELDLEELVLADTIRTRGGHLVHVTVSDGPRTEVEPWLQQLALAASGIPAATTVHRLENHYGTRSNSSTTWAPPGPDEARAVLVTLARAFTQGRSRLVPLPQDLALAFAAQFMRNRLDKKAWEVPAADWRSTLWRRFSEPWQLFYSGVPFEVFSDPATSRDPDSPPGFDSAFAAWAAAIYVPLLSRTA